MFFNYLASVQFNPISNRLNFFFQPNSWALITANGTFADNVVEKLKITCHHWGSSLEFPVQFNQQAFEESYEARQYWFSKLPGLALLDYRKQYILMSELMQRYNAQRANQIILQKLKLDLNCWGYLICFGGTGKSYAIRFEHQPPIAHLKSAVEDYYRLNIPRNNTNQTDIPQLLNEFEEKHQISPTISKILTLLFNDNKLNALSAINRSIQQQPSPLNIDTYDCTLHFQELNLKCQLPPLSFAIYCLYLEVEEGFSNANRNQFKQRAIEWYRRVKTSDDWESIIESCFDEKDKPWRDAVNNANKRIKDTLGNALITRHYTISGRNGHNKRITLDRNYLYFLR
jgi:hypothetical protein